jgi:ADP-ribose pyrophosphatase YjhB (NUDIX family)
MSAPWLPHVTVGAIVEREGQFLLVEEMVDGKLVLNQPAGHLEPDETLLQAVQRETLEETSWHFEPQALVGVYRWTHPTNGVTYHALHLMEKLPEKSVTNPGRLIFVRLPGCQKLKFD